MQSENLFSVIADLVSKNSLIVVIGFMLSLTANIIQVWSYFKQKRFEGAYSEAFKKWEKNLKGKYTDQQIKELKKEMMELQEKIASDIPNQARRVFLEEQINSLKDNISQSYALLEKSSKELKNQPRSPALPARLQQAIEENIMPSYLEKQRRQEIIYWLVVGSFAFTLITVFIQFAITPLSNRVEILGTNYPIRWLWQLGMSVLIISLLLFSWAKRFVQKSSKVLLSAIIGASWLLSLFSLFFLLLVSTNWATMKSPPSALTILATIIFVSIPITISFIFSARIISGVITRVVQRKRDARSG